MTTPKLKTIDILGAPVTPFTEQQALDYIDQAISSKTNLHIGVVNAAKIVNMERDSELRESVLASDLILADGIAVVWASKILGTPLPERVTGCDLMFGMFERGDSKKYRVYCLGATEEVSAKVEQKLAEDYPNVILTGRRNGYFTDEEEESIAKDIGDSKADILLVAITSPKKERFMAKWNDVMQVNVVHGVGGSFDVMAGKVERAPKIWQKMGMEWLYRVKQEPGRLWKRYLITNLLFGWLILKTLVNKAPIADLEVEEKNGN